MKILFKEYYRVLRKGGTLVLFYDIWKCEKLKITADKYNLGPLVTEMDVIRRIEGW